MNKIYVISDIHGEYDKYLELLSLINFDDTDTLYVLGDVVDRGVKPISVLREMINKPNIVPILGNHEVMTILSLKILNREISDETVREIEKNPEDIEFVTSWIQQGGNTTLNEFLELSNDEKENISRYLKEFSIYETININNQEYILLHAGLGNFSVDKPLNQYTIEELAFMRTDYSKKYCNDKFIITGHTPTRFIEGNTTKDDKIFRMNNHIAIDCGCVFGGKLAALCLNDGEEFYV